jgi:hypothetical protein
MSELWQTRWVEWVALPGLAKQTDYVVHTCRNHSGEMLLFFYLTPHSQIP